MGFLKEFKDFALKGNVMDMAVGVIIGGAFTAVVTNVTTSILQPIIGVVMGATTVEDWAHALPTYGSLLVTSIINFLITALVLFLIIKGIRAAEAKAAAIAAAATGKKEEEPAAPTTKICPFCKSEIPVDAVRCAHCTSNLE